MPKKTVINPNAQTQSQETFSVDRHQNFASTATAKRGITREEFEGTLRKVSRPLRESRPDTKKP